MTEEWKEKSVPSNVMTSMIPNLPTQLSVLHPNGILILQPCPALHVPSHHLHLMDTGTVRTLKTFPSITTQPGSVLSTVILDIFTLETT